MNAQLQFTQPQFIADQRLFELVLNPQQQRSKLQYLRFQKLPDRGDSSEETAGRDGRSRASLGGQHDHWQEVPDRHALLADPERRLLCLTVSAGIGKSMALQQLKLARPDASDRQLVIWLHFNDLEDSWEKIFDPAATTQSARKELLLVRRFRKVIEKLEELPISAQPDPDSLFHWLHSLLRHGDLTLAVDGLDEVAPVDGLKKAKALREFLAKFKRCRCAVAGRPYAITDTYWSTLFSTDADIKDDESSPWDFALVGTFLPEQTRRFLGSKVYREIERLQAETDLVPRTLEALRELPEKTLSTLRSVADVYWHSIDVSLKKDRETPGRQAVIDLPHQQILDLFSAYAITMVMWNHDPLRPHDQPLGQSPVRRIDENEMSKFRQRVLERLKPVHGPGSPDPWGETDEAFRNAVTEKMDQLEGLNASQIEFEYLYSREAGGLEWRNNTERDFFAALWMVRSSQDAERQWFGQRQSSVLDYPTDNQYFAELNECWRFICGLPDEALLDRDDGQGLVGRWSRLVQPLFARERPSPHADHARPTELMWRCWANLLLRSEWDLGLRRDWSEDELQQATTQVQHRVATAFDAAQTVADFKDQPINRVLFGFLAEYPGLRSGRSDSPELLEAKSIINEDLESQWVSFKRPPNGLFRCGHADERNNPERDREIRNDFDLGRYPVTNRLYALFDPHHASRFGNYERYSSLPRCAAIYINSWDSLMGSFWFHGFLSNEWEWEYACRLGGEQNEDGSNAIWYFGNEENDEKDESVLGEHAWYARNSVRQASEVGKLKPNPSGLHDMLGNVWEWCRNRYLPDTPSRVVRGGSCRSSAFGARCSRRYHVGPAGSGNRNGFRVARAPKRTP